MPQVDVFYSTQSDYCYFLIDRLLDLAKQGVEVSIRPVLGGVLRQPQRYLHRDQLEQDYFATDSQRVADYLGLPYAYPDPSPIQFKPQSLWIAESEQPRNELLNRLFIAAVARGAGLRFLDKVVRKLWDGSTPNWHEGEFLVQALNVIDLDMDELLVNTPWPQAKQQLDSNEAQMLQSGHWGVPLMVLDGEPFYGQDRFDHLLWRIQQRYEI